jgi:molybdopterin-guanine dinucleotide biosynthesis protein A
MHFSAALLAGGKSSRMGRDKAFIEMNGVALWRRQLAILRQLSGRTLFLAATSRLDGGRITRGRRRRRKCWTTGGVVAALRQCSSPLLLILAVDLPNMTANFCRSLLELSNDGRGQFLVASSGSN